MHARKQLAHLSSPLNQDIVFLKILFGEDTRTTVMIRNIPNKFKQSEILKLINTNNANRFDYFYLVMDLRKGANNGYAFINFTHHFYVLDFFLEFQGIKWSDVRQGCSSTKFCDLKYANIQGIKSLVAHHKDKNIMQKNDEQVKPK